ncbi:hypothetical protein G9F72_019115 [Clostridium estertheticum]|uniref:hypothetical protein n=1 Tax=Clostridium estertheticum TaxID=238834 RepID=UPI0013E95881|nr:hypothetical protein [Clostridium estertheticum]MBZ9688443.1 hypothetical protein [Clostridium estertheticum]
MSRNLVETIINIDSDDTNNIVRMLMLMYTFAGRNQTGKIEGITKLAILDFLLRYPVALDKALENIESQGNKTIYKKKFKLQSYEVNSIDAKMMKFNFAPWDFKYRRIVHILSAKDLIRINTDGKKTVLVITSKGIDTSNKIKILKDYEYLIVRCSIVKTVFGSWSQKKLIEMIYSTFPEILRVKAEMDVIL